MTAAAASAGPRLPAPPWEPGGRGGRVSLCLAPFLTSKEIVPEDWARLPTCILSRLCGRKEAVGTARWWIYKGGQCGSAEERARLTG